MKKFKIIYNPPYSIRSSYVMLNYKDSIFSAGGYVFKNYEATFNRIRLKHQV